MASSARLLCAHQFEIDGRAIKIVLLSDPPLSTWLPPPGHLSEAKSSPRNDFPIRNSRGKSRKAEYDLRKFVKIPNSTTFMWLNFLQSEWSEVMTDNVSRVYAETNINFFQYVKGKLFQSKNIYPDHNTKLELFEGFFLTLVLFPRSQAEWFSHLFCFLFLKVSSLAKVFNCFPINIAKNIDGQENKDIGVCGRCRMGKTQMSWGMRNEPYLITKVQRDGQLVRNDSVEGR